MRKLFNLSNGFGDAALLFFGKATVFVIGSYYVGWSTAEYVLECKRDACEAEESNVPLQKRILGSSKLEKPVVAEGYFRRAESGLQIVADAIDSNQQNQDHWTWRRNEYLRDICYSLVFQNSTEGIITFLRSDDREHFPQLYHGVRHFLKINNYLCRYFSERIGEGISISTGGDLKFKLITVRVDEVVVQSMEGTSFTYGFNQIAASDLADALRGYNPMAAMLYVARNSAAQGNTDTFELFASHFNSRIITD